jgi:threonyl-tRNA synthetase
MLQRIYGALYPTQAELDAYLEAREEAERRDHRRLGRELELFASDDLIGQGLPYMLPKGATIRRELERYIVDLELAAGYQHVYSPVLGKVDLYQTSGHWEHYQENMFPPMALEHEQLVLRPMNCPHHILIYQHGLHSYRELPIRIAEIGTMYRYERSGVVGGLSRVRAMALNDAHIFLRPDQIKQEFASVMQLVERVYADLGITDYRYRLSLRDPADTEKYVQNDAMWELGERVLREALEELGLPYYEGVGEAAFYGPKVDIQIRDPLGREETLSTIQVDFHLPNQFGLRYIGEDGQEHRPVILHRGVIGTVERMMAYLIELYEGRFPLWLAPVQAVIIPIADRHLDYAFEVRAALAAAGLRADVDDGTDRMGAKIRHAQLQKVPYMLVVGDREMEAGAVSVRTRAGGDLGAMPTPELLVRLIEERDSKASD